MTAVITLTQAQKDALAPVMAGLYNDLMGKMNTLQTKVSSSDFDAFPTLRTKCAALNWGLCDDWAAWLDALGMTMQDVFPSGGNSVAVTKPPRP